MRTFNRREKEIIKMLAKIDLANTDFFSYFLQKNYFTPESKKALFVITKQKTVLLYMENELFDNETRRKEELGKLFELLSLIIYLKESRYITIYPNPEVLKSDIHVMRDDFDSMSSEDDFKVKLNRNGLYIKTSDAAYIYNSEDNIVFKAIKLNGVFYNLMIENFMGLLYVSEELVELVKRNFISQEDVRFRKQQIATWVSIFLAFLLGVGGIYRQHSDSGKKNHEINRVIESQNNRFDKIDESINDFKMSYQEGIFKKE